MPKLAYFDNLAKDSEQAKSFYASVDIFHKNENLREHYTFSFNAGKMSFP